MHSIPLTLLLHIADFTGSTIVLDHAALEGALMVPPVL